MAKVSAQQALDAALRHHHAGQLEQAESLYRIVHQLDPLNSELLHLLGLVAYQRNRIEEGLELIRRAIAINPTVAEYHNHLGAALLDFGMLDEAIASCRKAIALRPDYPKAHFNLGNALSARKLFTEAIASYRRAITLMPDFPDAFVALGDVQRNLGQPDEAIVSFQSAISLKRDACQALNNLGLALKDIGQLDEAMTAFRTALGIKADFSIAHSNLILTSHYQPAYDAQTIAEEHRNWNSLYAQPFKKLVRLHTNDRNPDRRLRIGYVSPDYKEHPVGRCLLPLLAHHDRNKVEIFAYPQVPSPDAMTLRLGNHADHWHSLVPLTDEQAAELIRQHQIDILVDFAGHTGGNRLLVFARKPAPIQATYLGYPDTTGLGTMDYRIFDAHLDPPGLHDSFYAEKTICLPDCHLCFEAPADSPAPGPVPALKAGHITFGSLNNFCKVTARVLEIWSQILKALPNSRLILRCPTGSTKQRITGLFNELGITPDRIDLNDKRMQSRDYFALHNQMDIYLDTFPYSGFTTSLDALWMGVPLITLAGQPAVGRGGVVILSNVGMEECIAQTSQEYVHKAVVLANDLPRLITYRSSLRQRMQQSPLMDAPRFARNMEAAYRQMWRKWCGVG